jgi:hypothetical protein
VSEPKQKPDPIDRLHDAARWLHERRNDPLPFRHVTDKQNTWTQPQLDETVAYLRPVGGLDVRADKHPDIFSEAVAKARQEELEPGLVEVPYIPRSHRSSGVAAGFAVASSVAALAALVFVVGFPASQGPAGDDGSSNSAWTWLKSSLNSAPPRKPTPVVRATSDSTQALLSLGDRAKPPAVGTPATIAAPGSALGVSVSTATVPSIPVAAPPPPSPPQQQPVVASLPPPETSPEPQTRPEPTAQPVREINRDEVSRFVRRGEEMLATGDLQAARLLLLRAAEAHDARAALSLARTYDPIALKQISVADLHSDLEQARKWYQKAQEWGAPEAKRQLEALANYRR